jgi:hypothetical protein
MKLTTLEILNANNALPGLVQHLLQLGEVHRALNVSGTIRKLRPEAEVFQINQAAVLNAYGEEHRQSQQRIVSSDSETFEQYQEAMRALFDREITLNIEPITITAEEAQGLDAQTFISLSCIIEIEEEK